MVVVVDRLPCNWPTTGTRATPVPPMRAPPLECSSWAAQTPSAPAPPRLWPSVRPCVTPTTGGFHWVMLQAVASLITSHQFPWMFHLNVYQSRPNYPRRAKFLLNVCSFLQFVTVCALNLKFCWWIFEASFKSLDRFLFRNKLLAVPDVQYPCIEQVIKDLLALAELAFCADGNQEDSECSEYSENSTSLGTRV